MSDDESPVPSHVVTTPDPLTRPTREAATDTSGADDGETQSPAMRELFVKAQRVAPTELTILVTGDTGAGKEWLARWLHAHSPRAFRKFVPVNCGAIPDTLLDTSLFGQTSRTFTGEVHESLGMFEAATGGTLFLDHVGDASPAMQVKLLGMLEARQVQRVGEWQFRPINVRVVAATRRNLEDDVVLGRFREDLFYRLRVVELHIPALRERPGDLHVLARDLLKDAAARHHRPITGYAPEALACLCRYDWPGNVRELENAIEEACQVARGSEIQIQDLPYTVQPAAMSPSLPAGDPSHARRRRADLEQVRIKAELERHFGDHRQVAKELGMSLLTLNRKLRRRRRSPHA
jgi:two-component system response regulator HydG